MTKQYVPITTTPEFDTGYSDQPLLTYWNGGMGLSYAQLFVGSTDTCYPLVADGEGLYLCRQEEQPDPEVTALDRIANALESIAASLGEIEARS